MSNYLIGDFIRDTRLRRGYTQEELSFGICTPASLSRIENSSQTPGKHILDALLQRLGVQDQIFDVFVSKAEMEIYETIQAITRNIADYNYTELEKQILELEKRVQGGYELQRQYIVFARGILKMGRGGDMQEVMASFMNAIRMTLPDFDGVTPLEQNLLTFNEITIINSIASLYAGNGKIEEASRLEFWLKEYMDRNLIDGKEKRAKYPMILYNLSNWLRKQQRFEEAEQLTEAGIDFCIQYGNLVALPLLVFNKGCVLAAIGNIEEAKKFFRQSTVIFEATKQELRAKETVELCKKHYRIEF